MGRFRQLYQWIVRRVGFRKPAADDSVFAIGPKCSHCGIGRVVPFFYDKESGRLTLTCDHCRRKTVARSFRTINPQTGLTINAAVDPGAGDDRTVRVVWNGNGPFPGES